MVASAAMIPLGFWDEVDRIGLVKMNSLVPQILARYALAEEPGAGSEEGVAGDVAGEGPAAPTKKRR